MEVEKSISFCAPGTWFQGFVRNQKHPEARKRLSKSTVPQCDYRGHGGASSVHDRLDRTMLMNWITAMNFSHCFLFFFFPLPSIMSCFPNSLLLQLQTFSGERKVPSCLVLCCACNHVCLWFYNGPSFHEPPSAFPDAKKSPQVVSKCQIGWKWGSQCQTQVAHRETDLKPASVFNGHWSIRI